MKVLLDVMELIEQLPPVSLYDWRWWAISASIGVVGCIVDVLAS